MATIQKRGETYRIRASAGYDSAGKQITKSMTWAPARGMTQKQIEKELDRQTVMFEDKIKSGTYLDGNIKFQDFAEQWFNDYGKEHLRERTLFRYRQLSVRTYQAIGHLRLNRIQPRHLLEFYAQLSEPGAKLGGSFVLSVEVTPLLKQKGLSIPQLSERVGISATVLRGMNRKGPVSSKTVDAVCKALSLNRNTAFEAQEPAQPLAPKTIKHYHTFISSVFERAVKWGLIESNPCHRIDAPKTDHHEPEYLNDEEAAQFLTCLETEPLVFKALFTLLLFTGLRRGEALGLQWPDVDIEKSLITVRRTLQYTPARGEFIDDTKTEQSKRSLKVPDSLMALLREYKASQAQQRLLMGDRWQDTGFLFTRDDGRPMWHNTPYLRLQKILAAHGMRKVNLHSLRHTNATLLIQQGVNVRAISGRLGHSQTSTTMNIYAHQLQSADAAASDALEIALSKHAKRN